MTGSGSDQHDRIWYMLDRQLEAEDGPTGTWAQRWIPGVCLHERIRCTHGDEINARNGRRRVCRVCGRALKGPLPDLCFFTGRLHRSPRPVSRRGVDLSMPDSTYCLRARADDAETPKVSTAARLAAAADLLETLSPVADVETVSAYVDAAAACVMAGDPPTARLVLAHGLAGDDPVVERVLGYLTEPRLHPSRLRVQRG